MIIDEIRSYNPPDAGLQEYDRDLARWILRGRAALHVFEGNLETV